MLSPAVSSEPSALAQLAASISISQKCRSDCDQSPARIAYLHLQSFAPRTCYHWRFSLLIHLGFYVFFLRLPILKVPLWTRWPDTPVATIVPTSQSSLVLDKRKPTGQISEYSLGHCFHNHQGFLLRLWSTKLSSWGFRFRRGCCRANPSLKWK